ncbi:MAG: hypothetical protein ACAI25_01795, partial [Planctomycetota bacterium]
MQRSSVRMVVAATVAFVGLATMAPARAHAQAVTTVPSSSEWMTEEEEVAWINSLGFSCTVADLRASYAQFVPVAVDPAMSVLWNTETDSLRNYYRLYKRTGHPGFYEQAKRWRAFMVDTYSRWQNGGPSVVEPSHVYLMGLIDWYVDERDQATLDAIDRILDFIVQKVATSFSETRVTARCLQSLCYYLEKIGTRAAEVRPKIQDFLTGIARATKVNGFVCMKYYQGTNLSVTGLPAGQDLRTLFPVNARLGVVTGQNSFSLKGNYGCGVYQDVILMHALHLAARVLGDSTLASAARGIGQAWLPLVGRPFYDTAGTQNLVVPYYIVAATAESLTNPANGTPDLSMFRYPNGGSTPLYVTQYSCYCPDAGVRRTLEQQALLRQHGEYSLIQASSFGVKPRYWPWKTSEAGYFLTQKHGTATTAIPGPAPGPAARLTFRAQPTTVAAGASFSVQVSVVDSIGSVVTTQAAPVTLSLATNAAGATLSGTTTTTPVQVIATFPGLN